MAGNSELVAFRTAGFGHLAHIPEIECRYVFFEVGEQLWCIDICTDIKEAEQAKSDFDHIVETFKILP